MAQHVTLHTGPSMMRYTRLLRTVALLAAAAATSAPAVAAQVQPFVAAGLSVPAGTLAETADALPFGDAGLGLQLEGGLAFGFAHGAVDLRVFGTYASHGRDFDRINDELAGSGVDLQLSGSARIVGGGLGLVYYPRVRLAPRLYPYVLATGGVVQQRHTLEYSGSAVTPGTEPEVDTETRLAAGAGGGLIWDTGRLRIFLESRVQALLASDDSPGYNIPVQLGLKLGPP